MMHRKLWLIALILVAMPIFPAFASGEQLSRSVYKGSISGFKVEMVRTLTQKDGHNYTLQSEAKNLFASIKEVSEFQIKDGGIYPTQYLYTRKIFGRSTTEKIVFDWSSKSAFYSRSDRPQNDTTHKIHVGILDPALYQLALQADLATTKDPSLTYEFIKRKRLEQYKFNRLANESFSIQKKTYDALVVVRENEEKDRITRLWVIPELDFQVGQIRHTDDGDTYEVRLAEYQGNSAKLRDLYQRVSKAVNSE